MSRMNFLVGSAVPTRESPAPLNPGSNSTSLVKDTLATRILCRLSEGVQGCHSIRLARVAELETIGEYPWAHLCRIGAARCVVDGGPCHYRLPLGVDRHLRPSHSLAES